MDIKSIDIPFFMNQTFEPRVENFCTEALINEFLERGELKVGNREDADATLKGVVKSFHTSPISFDKNGKVMEYRATVTLDVSLKKMDDGVIIWESSGLSGDHEYAVSSDPVTTYENRRRATKKIAEDLAEDIHNRIFDNF